VIRVCVAGVTGWVGGPVADAVKAAGDLELVARVARSDATSFSSVAEALDAVSADVLVDYTSAMAVRENVLAAIERGVGVVVGSSVKGANIGVAALGREGWEDRCHGVLLPLPRRPGSAWCAGP
jgi:dihydrodipicolinate reductase